MKILVQWAKATPSDWEVMDSADFAKTPSRPLPDALTVVDDNPGYVNAINVQGVEFIGYDHYAVEDLPDGACRVTVWKDDPEDLLLDQLGEFHARVWTFLPLAPNSRLGGAWDTRQFQTVYADRKLQAFYRDNPVEGLTVTPLKQFSPPPADITRHGIWLPDPIMEESYQIKSRHGYDEWTDGVPPELLDRDGVLISQRDIGLYDVPDGTKTYGLLTTDLATSTIVATHENQMTRDTFGGGEQESSNSLSGGGSETAFAYSTPSGDPNMDDWPSGNYRCQFVVSAAGADLSFGLRTSGAATGRFARVNSSLTSVLQSWQQTEALFTGTGTKLATTGTIDPTAGGATDRFECSIAVSRPSSHGNQTLTVQHNGTSFADGPWFDAVNLSISSAIQSHTVDGAASALFENNVGSSVFSLSPLLNNTTDFGTALVGNGQKLQNFTVHGSQSGSLDGDVFAVVYAADGAGLPIGSVLATSAIIDGATFPLSDSDVTFDFTGADFTLTNGDDYVILMRWLDEFSTFSEISLRYSISDNVPNAIAVSGDFNSSNWQTETSDMRGSVHTEGGLTLTENDSSADLEVAAATHAQTADNLALTQEHVLVLADNQHDHSADNLGLTQEHVLILADGLHAHTAENPDLTQEHVLILDPAEHLHLSDNVNLTQEHVLALDDSQHDHLADNLDLTQEHALELQAVLHDHLADDLELSVVTVLTVSDAQHDHLTDNLALSQDHFLILSEALHDHSADSIQLSQLHLLDPSAVEHEHLVDNLDLSQSHFLSTQDAIQAHLADNLVLTIEGDLPVDSAIHSHEVDNLALTQQHVLAVADVIHAHLADGLDLTQEHILALVDALHLHSSDHLELSSIPALSGLDSVHVHTAENISLSQEHILELLDALHAHTSDNVPVNQSHQLSISDIAHELIAEAFELSQQHVLNVFSAIHPHSVEDFGLGDIVHVLTVDDVLHDHIAHIVRFGYLIEDSRVLVLQAKNRSLILVKKSQVLSLERLNRLLDFVD